MKKKASRRIASSSKIPPAKLDSRASQKARLAASSKVPRLQAAARYRARARELSLLVTGGDARVLIAPCDTVTATASATADDDDTEGQGETRSPILGQCALPRAGGPPRDSRPDVVGAQHRGRPADATISGASAAARARHIAGLRK